MNREDLSSSNSECPNSNIIRCGFFVQFGLANTMILNLPQASKDRIALEQVGTCLNLIV